MSLLDGLGNMKAELLYADQLPKLWHMAHQIQFTFTENNNLLQQFIY